LHTNLRRRALALAALPSVLALSAALNGCAWFAPASVANNDLPPPAPREFRAAWVATVANIDWPSKGNTDSTKQQLEAIAILDRAKAMNLNAIVLQVRPSADAIYASKIEPWSEYLTGQQGLAPMPEFDPLQFWVSQAHARGIELHAWLNPYRARHSSAKTPNSPEHIANTIPSAVKTYGSFQWMDPGDEQASKQTLAVVLDVVKRYDIDGIHLDDYFYPYPIEAEATLAPGVAALDGAPPARAEVDFPDQPSWQRYVDGGGKLARADWRRQNVNTLIEAMSVGIHRQKSWVRFGVSPFGIAKPGPLRPATINGFSQYDKLYADAELWLEKGWVDYFAPQLYWPVSQTPQAYDVLLDYWIKQNAKGRHIWPGLFTSRLGAPTRSYQPAEVLNQIKLAHDRQGATGHIHFSMAALMENRNGITDLLKASHYAAPALVPATPWLGAQAPAAPAVGARRGAAGLALSLPPGDPASNFAIWSRYGKQWRFAVAPGASNSWTLPDDATAGPANAVYVSAVDRLGNESTRVAVVPPAP
jgi:uncharacterized lipoprotein YddW (UPF0748 family)